MTGEHRPETILSEFGEGYCRVCHFVVGLGYDGLLAPHWRGQSTSTECKGSRTRPPKITPYASRLVAFKTTPPKQTCPECEAEIAYTSAKVFTRHWSSATTVCPGSGRPVKFKTRLGPERDHSNDRG